VETILDKIVAQKREDIQQLTDLSGDIIRTFKKERSFIEGLRNAQVMAVISEFKRASPSKGLINANLDPAEQAAYYADYGASAISVLCDRHFQGSLVDLSKVREAVSLPILCKDFIVEQKQISYAKAAGADLILLIASILSDTELEELYQYANEIGLEVLVEIHDERELEKALNVKAELIGINNRDLKSFQVNLETTEKLGPLVRQSGAFLISESGMKTQDDVKRAARAGANGILVGETFMATTNLHQAFKEFKIPLEVVSDR
jgi:indole-3-glycerol phosphate synthase